MGWLDNRLRNIKRLNKIDIIAIFTSKILIWFSLGLMAASYFNDYNWPVFGLVLIILAIIIGIPVAIKILK